MVFHEKLRVLRACSVRTVYLKKVTRCSKKVFRMFHGSFTSVLKVLQKFLENVQYISIKMRVAWHSLELHGH